MQAEKELSIPAQLQELKEYAADNNMEIVEIYTDEGVSAKTDDRPEFQKMIAEAKQDPRPFDVILYHKNDRFARNREDAIVYKSLLRRDCGIELIAIKEDFGDGPVAKMIEGILEVIAEFYSLNLAQEVRKGMKEKAKQGKAMGEPPLGYEIGSDGYYKIVEDEAKVVQYIFDEYINTNKGLRAIAIDLRDRGKEMFGEAGNKYKWSGTGVGKILRNRAYIGELVWNRRDVSKNRKIRKKDEWINVKAHDSIISKKKFDKAQEIIEEKKLERAKSKDYLLKGLVKCMNCGSNMSLYTRRHKTKTTRQLRCSNYVHTGECYFNHVKMDKIKSELFNYLERISGGSLDLKKLNINYKNNSRLETKLQGKKKKLNNIDSRFDRQMEAYENGVIELEQLEKYKKRLKNEKAELQNEVTELKEKLSCKNTDISKIKNKLSDIISIIKDNNISLVERRKALKKIIDYIEYDRKHEKMQVNFIF